MQETVSTWYRNIIEADMRAEPEPAENGNLRTPGAYSLPVMYRDACVTLYTNVV